jgi:hypothetical protein
MAIALLSTIQRVVHWLAGGSPAPRAQAPRASNFVAARAVPACLPGTFAPQAAARTVPSRPARVVRVTGQGPCRMVISGRMADVCAEIDRLAALEAAAG